MSDDQIISQKVKLSGSTDQLTGSFDDGQRVYLLCEGTIDEVAIKRTKNGRERVVKVAATEVVLVDAEAGHAAVQAMRLERMRAEEAVRGVEWLPGMAPGDLEADPGIAVTTDASGVVLTDDELEAVRAERDPFAGADAIADAALDQVLDPVSEVPGWGDWLEADEQSLRIRLDAVSSIRLRHLSELVRIEQQQLEPREGLIEYLTSRQAEEVAALQEGEPPWPGFAQQSHTQVLTHLQQLEVQGDDLLDVCEQVWAWEQLHKGRKSVLAWVSRWQEWSSEQ